MPNQQTLAVAAHLHVLLRRRIGRNTDIEWLAANPAYAVEIHRLCSETTFDDLHEWAAKLMAAHDLGLFDAQIALRPAVIRKEPAAVPGRNAVASEKRYVASLR